MAVLVVLIASPAHAQGQPPLVPQQATLGESAQRALDAPWLTADERAAMRVFHGVWTDEDLDTAEHRAIIALNAWDFDCASLRDESTPVELRAEALLLQGMVQDALGLLEGKESLHASRVRAEAYELRGDFQAAIDAVAQPVRRLMAQQTQSAAELTDGVEAMLVRSRAQGQPARDFQTMMSLLGRAQQELDRLYWPALVSQAKLLDDKDDTREAVGVLHETLALNPRSADAWFLLGRIAVRTFDFPSAARAAAHLRALNPTHPLADLLLAESWLVQDDPDSALELIEPLLERLPKLRQAHALHAATHAIFYDEPAMFAALGAFDALSPGSAMAHAVVGRHLSLNRQYELAAEILEQAIERQPNWPAPQIELGLMELQAGRDSNARHALRAVTQLDPFNKRAANSLLLLEELADYNRIETEHFIIRYKPGIDEVMVRMMPEKLEEIHRTVSGRFESEPDRKTIIELMPDHQRFAVRITGMPFIHTIAACTGPVIAMEVPRVGRQGMHSGLYDWPRVLQHEYTHTITLAQTRNRIPHWLTEAAAVEMELSPRDYNTAQMLARSFEQGTLFDLDEIKWAFVRPRQPGDRSKAYAQGHWMLQYMNERFGDDAVIRLLERYFEGEREREAMPSALGVSREAFFEDFLLWAERQVRQWGLAASPTIRELMETHQRTDPDMIEAMRAARQQNLQAIADAVADRIGRGGEGEPLRGEQWPRARMPQVEVDDALLSGWLTAHPDHPDLVELKLRRALRDGVEGDPLLALLHRYANLRPLDPFPHQQLARLYLESEEPWRAVEHLETLDQHEQYSPVYAVQLARLYRQAGELELAMARATRALHIDPYRPAHRELAAAIAVQLQQYDIALMHIEALTMLEPDRPQHARRLDAIKRLAN